MTDIEQRRTPQPRGDLAAIPPYRAGKSVAAPPGQQAYRLSSNEHPRAPLPEIQAALADLAAQAHRYPDPGVQRLTQALAQFYDIPESWVATGTGGVSVLQQIALAMVGPGDDVLFPWRSFEAYPIVTQVAGARIVTTPLAEDESIDVPALLAAVTPRTKLLYLCTPNNPTGLLLSRAEITLLLEQLPSDILVVLDEAYREFLDEDQRASTVSGIDAVKRWPNVLVLRTFSKAASLANLRVGYAIGQPEIIEALRKVALPFGVSSFAEVAATTALAHWPQVLEQLEPIRQRRALVLSQLRELGVSVPDTAANFVWLPTRLLPGARHSLAGRDEEFVQQCAAAGLAVRHFPGDGVRVSIGEPAAMERFLELVTMFFTTVP